MDWYWEQIKQNLQVDQIKNRRCSKSQRSFQWNNSLTHNTLHLMTHSLQRPFGTCFLVQIFLMWTQWRSIYWLNVTLNKQLSFHTEVVLAFQFVEIVSFAQKQQLNSQKARLLGTFLQWWCNVFASTEAKLWNYAVRIVFNKSYQEHLKSCYIHFLFSVEVSEIRTHILILGSARSQIKYISYLLCLLHTWTFLKCR